jgi:DNA-binding GntR family transcriptional regulator
MAVVMAVEDGYAKLRDAIVAGELQPNERLVEADLSQAFGMGRTAVRTALVRLEQERLVEREPNRGAKVRFVSEREAVEILEARSVLEGITAAKAAERATPEDVEGLRGILDRQRSLREAGDLLAASDANADFHRRIKDIARHETADRLISSLHSQMVRFQYRTILVPGRAAKSLEEHTAIADAIAAKNPTAAEAAIREHLSHVTDALRGEESQ